MKIADRVQLDGSTLVHRRTFDANPILEDARGLREKTGGVLGENRHLARIPAWLVHEWAKEAGVRMDDSEAMSDLLARKLEDPDNGLFRVWGGTFR